MKKIFYLSLLCTSLTVQAEVFKCPDKFGKAAYQSKPCQEVGKGKQLDIKADPAKEAQGRAMMEALDRDYTQRKQKESEQASPQNNPPLNVNTGVPPN
jgi:hypothetical protein